MIVVTGAAGFIGSCLVQKLNEEGLRNVLAVDDFSRVDKQRNLAQKKLAGKIERSEFLDWLDDHPLEVSFVFHLGARTDTTETNTALLDRLNLLYSQRLWTICVRHHIPLVYASSAATYGRGEQGYHDRLDNLNDLQPLNAYGESKHNFDKWVLQQGIDPPFWAGLKFFNVYGPNEYHKGRMASVIFHAVRQINDTGRMKLFRSHRPDIADGHQSRDFIYVKDVVEVLYWFYKNRPPSSIYNLGTGTARTFLDLVTQTFLSLDKKVDIEFIDTPADLRDKYQYFTEADMSKLRLVGYSSPFISLEEGVDDYVRNYLREDKIY